MALHPRYEAYGLTEADAALVNSFRHAARAAGWSGQQIDSAFEWYKQQGEHLARMSPEDMAAAFVQFTTSRGWSDQDRETALGWFDAAGAALERGEPPPQPSEPTAEDDRLRRADLERMMREDPDAYWRDSEAQQELYEINERAAGAPTLPNAPTPPLGRRAAIEEMMRSDPARYWSSPDIQSEFRQLLGGGAVEPAGEGSAMGPEPAGGAAPGGGE